MRPGKKPVLTIKPNGDGTVHVVNHVFGVVLPRCTLVPAAGVSGDGVVEISIEGKHQDEAVDG